MRPRLEALEDRLAPAAFQSLYSFTGGNDGFNPLFGVIVDSNGNLYGTAPSGGANGGGTAFQFNLSSLKLTTIHSFSSPGGSLPYGGLIQDSSGNLYGVALNGGSGGQGTVYRLSPDGTTYTVLHSFSGSSEGAFPQGNLLMDGKGNLFGETLYGGTNGKGTVYELSPNSSGGYDYTTLHSFNGSDGYQPGWGLVMDGSGNLYGTTLLGGTQSDGTVFQLSLNGSGGYNFTTLHSFNGSDGLEPEAGLVMDSNGNLFGTTSNGGANGLGDAFELNPSSNAFTVIHSFKSLEGYSPSGNLILDSQGNLYGTTGSGGITGDGTLYKLSPDGTGGYRLVSLFTFSGNLDGSDPDGGLFVDSSGNLYGTTVRGGGKDNGTIFEMSGVVSVGSTTTTSASNASTPFSTNTQNVNLTADVTSSAGPVNEGTVTFTVMQGATVIGSATTSGTVASGAAGVSYALPANQAAGTYTIDAVYSGGPDFEGSSDDTHTLTISAASTTTAASNATAVFSSSTQYVNLTADVTSSAGPVDEGTVTFTVMQGSNILGTATTSNTVANGAAGVSYALPAALAAGTYTIDAVYNPGPDFTGSFDDTHTLTVNTASTGVSAGNAKIVFSTSTQNVTLTAGVTSSAGTVGEGTVTFTVMQGSSVIGTATTSNIVSNGAASVNYALPAGTAAGAYIIDAVYNPGPDFQGSSDDTHTLTVKAASTTAAAGHASAVFRPGAQNVTLTAGVTSAAGMVNEGTITFTLMRGITVIGTPTTSSTVSNGQASVSYALPAGSSAGNYTIDAVYNPGPDFLGSFDDTHTLAVAPANVTTSAGIASANFSSQQQTVTLSATLADSNFSSDTVNEGTVTFTVLNGLTSLGSASGTVNSNGTASANFSLPAGQAIGNYTIAVSYSDSAGNFTDSGHDVSNTLTVNPTNVTVKALNPPSVVYSLEAQSMTLSAKVTNTSDSSDTVNEGSVIFTIMKGTSTVRSVAGAVSGGVANADFTLPPGQAAGNYTIAVQYTDSPSNFVDSGDTGAAFTVNPASVAVAANNVTTAYNLNTQTLLLSARVSNTNISTDTVDEGIVTFTVEDGSSPPDTVQNLVANGAANAAFTLPAGLPSARYIIDVGYSDNQGNFSETSNTSGYLTVSPNFVATSANGLSAFYSPNAQTLKLSANVDNLSVSSQAVGEGVVAFTVTDKNGNTVGKSVQGTVSGGKANTTFTLPAGLSVGSYTIAASYSDSSDNFTDRSNNDAALTILPANVAVAAKSVSTIYNTNTQTLALSAGVADASITTDTVDEGAVTFTILNGNTTVGTAQGTVSGGTANTNFTLPAGLAAGSYTIDVSYTDSTGYFSNSDSNARLTVSAAKVTTFANLASAVYSSNTQLVKLSAGVSNASVPGDTVNEGEVTFTLQQQNGTAISSVAAVVIADTAHASLTLPAGLSPGLYFITVGYSDLQGNFSDGGDTSAPLTIGTAAVVTTAAASTAVYSSNAQTVTVNANVANTSVPSDTVNEGVVIFTISGEGTVLGPEQGTVSNGAASANFTLPAGLAAGSYTIVASYNDSQDNLAEGGGTNGILTVAPAQAITTAAAASTTFRTAEQTVTLSAAVVNPGPINLAVGEGVVFFTILSGNTVVGSAAGAVNGGTANAAVTLPAGLAAGSYAIAVNYSDSQGNFLDNGDNNSTLTIGAAGTTAQLTQVTLAPNYSSLTTTETLTAHVSSSSPVALGSVTFFASGHTATANVDGNGNAAAVVTLPMLQLLGPQDIRVQYNDAANNRTPSADAQTAAWRMFNPIVHSTATFAPNSDAVTADLFGLFITYTNGLLTEIDFGSIHLVFSYNAGGGLAQVTFDGMALLS